MEQNFQTSFIPKKPMIDERVARSRSIGVFAVLAIFILFTILLATVALYFYKAVLTRNITQTENNLNLAKNRFEPAKIAELQTLDRRLKASSEILRNHIAITPIFKVLQTITMKTVGYTKFTYDFGTGLNTKILIKINGIATGYRSIALQSDLFTQNKNLIDPVFSNLTLNDKGDVSFNLEFSVDLSFVDYKQTLLTES